MLLTEHTETLVFEKLRPYLPRDAAAELAREIAEETAGQRAIATQALWKARDFITNGVALGFIRLPDAATPDPAHETLPMICRALGIPADRAAPRPLEMKGM